MAGPTGAGSGGAAARPAGVPVQVGGPSSTETPPPLVLGAAVQGSAHARRGTACQDAFAWALLPGGGAAAALADGAGSARWAETGARTAAEAAVDAAGRHGCAAPAGLAATCGGSWGPSPALARTATLAACAASEAVRARAAELRAAPRDLACTLLVVVWAAGRIAVAHVGDGAAVGLADRGGWDLLSEPDAGEYVNETRFLTDADWRRHLRIAAPAAAYEGVVAISDGCQRAMLRPGADGRLLPFAGFLDPVGRFARRRAAGAGGGSTEIERLLAAPKLSGISDDDRTLIVLWRRAGDG